METTLDVKGMTCGHCEKAVNNALEELAGVSKVAVDLDTGKVGVTYDESKVTEGKLREAVEEQGYDLA